MPGFRYLLAVRTSDGHICAYYGPFQAASNDITLLHQSKLMEQLPEGEFVIADGLFAEQPNFLTPLHDRAHYDYWDKFIGAPNIFIKPLIFIYSQSNLVLWRSKVEHVIGRLKEFNVLNVPFRHHSSEHHELVFRVLCKIFNIVNENFRPVQQTDQ